MSKGMLIIISGPSGSGKGTVVKRLCPCEGFALSVSVTTRKKRIGEVEGRDYLFRTEEQFKRMLENGELLESTLFVGNYYGTPRPYVIEQIEQGKTVVLEIEVNGALQVKERFTDAVLIFLMPPNMNELKQRLINRNTDSLETIENRLHKALEEIKLIDKYDYLVINDGVENAVEQIQAIVKAEKLKPHRCRSKVEGFYD